MSPELTENEAIDMVVHYFTKVTPHPTFKIADVIAGMTGLAIYVFNQGVEAERGKGERNA